MICRLCKQKNRLVQAHIIPASFYKSFLKKGPLFIFSTDEKIYPKKSQTGVYDKGIVCLNCEKKFDLLDDYAHKILLKSECQYIPIGDLGVYEINEFNYENLKLFFISMLWRASVSKRAVFGRVQTGPFEEKLSEMIIKKDAGNPEDFAVILTKFTGDLKIAASEPYKTRIGDTNFYRFYFSNYEIFIKVDRRDTPEILKPLILNPRHSLIMLAQSSLHSKDVKVLLEIAKKIKKTRK